MKKLLFIIAIAISYSCNDPDAPDCLRKAGDLATFNTELEEFNEIEVNDEFIVFIQTGTERSISITAGENLLPNIRFEIVERKLVLSDGNGCSWVRNYNFPAVTITTPELTRIRQNGGGLITSDQAVTFPEITLISEDRTGDFDLIVSNNSVQITSNDLSNFKLKGRTEKLVVGFFSGDGRFDGSGLAAKEVEIFQRGTNDMVVHATESLTGRIISNGNVIYTKTIPPVVDVSLEGSGNLIFKE
ncbi:MAG: head GIN domain-containing protein [Bacteroidota bacterium]